MSKPAKSNNPLLYIEALEKLSPFTGESSNIRYFRSLVHRFYRNCGRTFPWRDTQNPYHIWVSEIMLQQTQTERVSEKYQKFIAELPNPAALDECNVDTLLKLWSGLGYYRRALNLKKAAHVVTVEYGGVLPGNFEALKKLPGIGEYTAAAICNFAWSDPHVMIETNIRTVFLHLFYPRELQISDNVLKPVIQKTLDRDCPKEWFYALMDLGVAIKRARGAVNKRSAHYVKQSTFVGSHRQKRAAILRVLHDIKSLSPGELAKRLSVTKVYALGLFDELHAEGFLEVKKGRYSLSKCR